MSKKGGGLNDIFPHGNRTGSLVRLTLTLLDLDLDPTYYDPDLDLDHDLDCAFDVDLDPDLDPDLNHDLMTLPGEELDWVWMEPPLLPQPSKLI